MYSQKILIFCAILLSSCCTTPPPKEESLNDVPISPSLVQYKNGPILEKNGDNYLVTKELVTNATLLTDYYKRMEKWKEVKGIR